MLRSAPHAATVGACSRYKRIHLPRRGTPAALNVCRATMRSRAEMPARRGRFQILEDFARTHANTRYWLQIAARLEGKTTQPECYRRRIVRNKPSNPIPGSAHPSKPERRSRPEGSESLADHMECE